MKHLTPPIAYELPAPMTPTHQPLSTTTFFATQPLGILGGPRSTVLDPREAFEKVAMTLICTTHGSRHWLSICLGEASGAGRMLWKVLLLSCFHLLLFRLCCDCERTIRLLEGEGDRSYLPLGRVMLYLNVSAVRCGLLIAKQHLREVTIHQIGNATK